MKRSRLWLLPLLLAAIVAGGFYFESQAKKGDRELDVYVVGGQRMADGEEIYRRGTDGKPFTYPPFAAVPFVPFAWLPQSLHAHVWFAVDLLILLAMLRWLHRHASRADPALGPPRLWWFWVPTAVFGGRHVVSVFTNQSHDLLIAGLVAMTAAAWCRGRATAGIWAGLGAATKATPLLFIGLFGLSRRWFALLALVATLLAATLLPDLLFPRQDGAMWWRAWYDVNLRGLEVGGTADAAGAWNPHSVLNQSLSGATTRLFTPVVHADSAFVVGGKGEVLLFELAPGVVKAVTIALQLGVLALISLGVLAGARAERSAGRDGSVEALVQRSVGLGEVAAFACGMVLLSPQSSKSHFCIWLFPVAFVVDHLLRRRRDPVALGLLVLAAVLGLLSKDLVGKRLGNVLLAYGTVAWSTLCLLAATVRCLGDGARSKVR